MTDIPTTTTIGNGQAIDLDAVPLLSWAKFRGTLAEQLNAGCRISAYFGDADGAAVVLYAVLAEDAAGRLHLMRTRIDGATFESLAVQFPQIQLFEREIAEQFGLRPKGHPWLKPVRYPEARAGRRSIWEDANGGSLDLRPGTPGSGQGEGPVVGTGDFYRVDGEQIHEVAVGPVHAGIIEPGHFRFQCHGEHVYHLEIVLGYQHRGVERAMAADGRRGPHLMETAAGDTSIGHATAYCQLVEALSGVTPPVRAQAIRGIALELERIANHVGDLGALAGDVGFLPTMSYCGRIRGDFLNMTAAICGNRFGRSLVRPGGARFDIEPARAADLLGRLDAAYSDTASAVNLLWDSPSVMARFEETGTVSEDVARQIGLVGPAARACGIDHDVRRDFALGIYRYTLLPVTTWHTGDVFARAYVRWLEIQQSVEFIREQLRGLPDGAICAAVGPLSPGGIAVSISGGWRGEICHVAITGPDGRIGRYKIVDPSFHNWFGLAQALRNQQMSDFPLCNKSFNLSYCGHDL